MPTARPREIETDGAVDRNRKRPFRGRKNKVPVENALALGDIGENVAKARRRTRRKQVFELQLQQCRSAAPEQAFGRDIDLLDAPGQVAGDQHVGHGGHDPGYERLRFLKGVVLGLELDLLGQQFGVGLVHLADDGDPRLLGVHALCFTDGEGAG